MTVFHHSFKIHETKPPENARNSSVERNILVLSQLRKDGEKILQVKMQ
jgi:hypothetical protein